MLTVQSELWALERELDSMSQKGLPVARQLGRVRSIILRTHSDDQKTLKRWIKPAPNHVLSMAKREKVAKERKKQLVLF